MENKKYTFEIDWFAVLTIVFIVLKLCDEIDWSWLWVLSPIWGELVIYLIYVAVKAITLKRAERKVFKELEEMAEKSPKKKKNTSSKEVVIKIFGGYFIKPHFNVGDTVYFANTYNNYQELDKAEKAEVEKITISDGGVISFRIRNTCGRPYDNKFYGKDLFDDEASARERVKAVHKEEGYDPKGGEDNE